MAEIVHRLLEEFERASGHLDAATRTALRNEISCHLAASIQARMEIGSPPEAAEREAVAAFGDVREIVSRIDEQVRASHTSRRLVWLSVGFFAWCAAMSSDMVVGSNETVIKVFGSALILSLVSLWVLAGVATVRHPKWRLRPHLALFAALVPLMAFNTAQHYVSTPSGAVHMRNNLEAPLRAVERGIAQQREMLSSIDRWLAEPAKSRLGWLPKGFEGRGNWRRWSEGDAAFREQFSRSVTLRRSEIVDGLGRLERSREEIRAAGEEPVWREMPRQIPYALGAAAFLVAAWMLPHALVVLIAAVAGRMRRTWRRLRSA